MSVEAAAVIDTRRPEQAGAERLRGLRADLARYRSRQPGRSAFSLMLLNQGLWALSQCQITRRLHESRLPTWVKKPLLVLCVLWQTLIEVLTGIELPYQARIARGLYIGHFGAIIIYPDIVIGAGCNLSQGVTLGVSGRGSRRGVPVLGERVYVGANAVIAGSIYIGDDAVVAANALVTRDVVSRAVVLGKPAKIVSFKGSGDYLAPGGNGHE